MLSKTQHSEDAANETAAAALPVQGEKRNYTHISKEQSSSSIKLPHRTDFFRVLFIIYQQQFR